MILIGAKHDIVHQQESVRMSRSEDNVVLGAAIVSVSYGARAGVPNILAEFFAVSRYDEFFLLGRSKTIVEHHITPRDITKDSIEQSVKS